MAMRLSLKPSKEAVLKNETHMATEFKGAAQHSNQIKTRWEET